MPNRKELPSIRNFDAFAAERRLFKNLPLSILKDATLGIDVDHFVSRTLSLRREPLIHAIGGFPFGIEAALETLVESLQSNGIKPLFVLRGLELAPVDPAFSSDSKQQQQRSQAWAQYEKGDGEEAVKTFDDSPVDIERASRQIIKILVDKGLKFMVAPFTISAQLSYLAENGYIDAVYGSSDAFLYGVDKLITSVDTRNMNFQWINKKHVLNELNFTHDQFVEAGIAAGCELNKVTFPPVDHMINSQPIAPVTALKAIQDLTQAHMSIYAAIMAFPDPETNPSYADRFRKALSAVKYQPVLKSDGKVEPLVDADVPNDIHEFIGQRLPDEILYYFSRGLIGPELLNTLSTGVFKEEAPLDGGESKQYRKFVTQLHSIRSKSLNYLTQTMHRYYQFKPAKYMAWFDKTEKQFDKINPPLYISIGSKWKVPDSILQTKFSTPSLSNVVQSLSDKSFVEKSLHVNKESELDSDNEILSNSIYRVLQTIEFVSKDHELTGWGKVLEAAVSREPEYAEELMVLITLFKDGYLNGNELDPEYPGGPVRGSENDKKYTRLVSRVASAIDLKHKPVGYTGPLSRNVLAFHSFIATQTRVYRNLVESSLVSLLGNGDANRVSRDSEDWSKMAAKIPFRAVPSDAIGIAMKSYLDESLQADSKKARDTLPVLFKQAVDVEKDIKRAFALWDSLMVGVRRAKELDLAKDIMDITAADDWLKSKRF